MFQGVNFHVCSKKSEVKATKISKKNFCFVCLKFRDNTSLNRSHVSSKPTCNFFWSVHFANPPKSTRKSLARIAFVGNDDLNDILGMMMMMMMMMVMMMVMMMGKKNIPTNFPLKKTHQNFQLSTPILAEFYHRVQLLCEHLEVQSLQGEQCKTGTWTFC